MCALLGTKTSPYLASVYSSLLVASAQHIGSKDKGVFAEFFLAIIVGNYGHNRSSKNFGSRLELLDR